MPLTFIEREKELAVYSGTKKDRPDTFRKLTRIYPSLRCKFSSTDGNNAGEQVKLYIWTTGYWTFAYADDVEKV